LIKGHDEFLSPAEACFGILYSSFLWYKQQEEEIEDKPWQTVACSQFLTYLLIKALGQASVGRKFAKR